MISSLYEKVDRAAGVRSGEVLHRAVRAMGDFCPHCEWWPNRREYERLLQNYVAAKMWYNKLKKRERCESSTDSVIREMCEEHKKMISYKQQKDKFRPCAKCQARHNPHRKLK